MRATVRCAVLIAAIFTPFQALVLAQAPPPEIQAELQQQQELLTSAIESIPETPHSREYLPDVAIYAKAADWIIRHSEFYRPDYVDKTREALQTGLERAKLLADGKAPWVTGTGGRTLAYRSKLDGSLQPYGLSLPEGVDPNDARQWPLYVVLHGRNGRLTEVSHIATHDGRPVAEGQQWIQLDVFGRVNNGYRWAGEVDVMEAIADVQRRYRIDRKRITLWGFSMGGAGAWHLGLHYPSMWSSVGAGAGFVDTYLYQKIEEPLPRYQHLPLRIYDADRYALNAADVPVITYGGELDAQLVASTQMRDAAREQGVEIELLIGKGMGHKFNPESLEKFMAFHAEHSRKGRPAYPGLRSIRFVTYTPKYNECEWLTINEMFKVYQPAIVEGEVRDDGTLVLKTQNVAVMQIARDVAYRAEIDGSELPLSSAADGLLPTVYFVKSGRDWDVLDYESSRDYVRKPDVRKRHNLQGPIDDAFMTPFICIRGTGKPWDANLQQWADWTLQRFTREYDKWLRAELPVMDDTEFNATPKEQADELLQKNLVLFGDPGSNEILARLLDMLPIEWSDSEITVAGKSYPTGTHGLAMIFPNPLNPKRYVVINSGHTFHEDQFRASNAQLYPRLGDIAVLKFTLNADGTFSEETVWAELFDDNWELE